MIHSRLETIFRFKHHDNQTNYNQKSFLSLIPSTESNQKAFSLKLLIFIPSHLRKVIVKALILFMCVDDFGESLLLAVARSKCREIAVVINRKPDLSLYAPVCAHELFFPKWYNYNQSCGNLY